MLKGFHMGNLHDIYAILLDIKKGNRRIQNTYKIDSYNISHSTIIHHKTKGFEEIVKRIIRNKNFAYGLVGNRTFCKHTLNGSVYDFVHEYES